MAKSHRLDGMADGESNLTGALSDSRADPLHKTESGTVQGFDQTDLGGSESHIASVKEAEARSRRANVGTAGNETGF